jgi:hypothetical protein
MPDPLVVLEPAEPPVRTRTLVVPDLGAGALAVLTRLEEVLATLAAWEEAEDWSLVLPTPIAGERALSAARRLWDALAPTQAPGEGVEFAAGQPVHLVEVEQDDLDVLAATAVRFCQAVSATPAAEDNAIADALDQHLRGGETTASQLLADLVRLHSVLDLASTVDAGPLRAALDAGVFPRDLKPAYVDLVAGMTRVWSYAAY